MSTNLTPIHIQAAATSAISSLDPASTVTAVAPEQRLVPATLAPVQREPAPAAVPCQMCLIQPARRGTGRGGMSVANAFVPDRMVQDSVGDDVAC